MECCDPTLKALLSQVTARSGLVFDSNRLASAEQVVKRAMQCSGAPTLADYAARVRGDENAFNELLSQLTVGETYFFREPEQFEWVRRHALPEIVARRGPGHTVRIWSAGCSSGEEPYSLAILCLEAGLAGSARIIGTDISATALAKARRAFYTDWSLRGEGRHSATPYLTRRKDGYQLDERIRGCVDLEPFNLVADPFPSLANGLWGMDLILCRNVFIYFGLDVVETVARRFLDTLAPGGWLITASCDPPLAGVAGFETIVTDAGIVYRRPLPVALMAAPSAAPLSRQADMHQTPPPPLPLVNLPPLPPETVFDLRPNAQPATDEALTRPDSPLRRAKSAPTKLGRAVENDQPVPMVDPEESIREIRLLANVDLNRAEQRCAEAVRRQSMSPDLLYLHALLLLELRREEEAGRVARQLVYLNPELAIGHFTLGLIRSRQGSLAPARRAFRNARDLCAAQPPEEPVPLTDDEPAGRLLAAANAQLAILDSLDNEPAAAAPGSARTLR